MLNRIFISSDIEGTCGIAHWDETELNKPDYAYFRQQMTSEVAAEAYVQQREAMETDDREGVVQEYLDTLLPADWDKMDLYQRRSFLGGSDFSSPAVGTERRTRVCAMEVWCECFGKSREALKKADSYEIESILYKLGGWKKYPGSASGKARFPGYGVQKCYVRVSEEETATAQS